MVLCGLTCIYSVDFRKGLYKRGQCEQASHNPLVVPKETVTQCISGYSSKAKGNMHEVVSDLQEVEAGEKGNGQIQLVPSEPEVRRRPKHPERVIEVREHN